MTDVQNKFKLITDSKYEPTLEEAQEFVGGMVEGISFQYTRMCKLGNTTCSSGTPLYKKGGWGTTYN